MMKFRNEEGLTLIELLITLAVIAVVFAIAVPVFSNVLAVAEADAATAQQAALDSFAREYATTTLSYDSASNTTTATLNGDVIATIKGNATASVQPVAPAPVTYTSSSWQSASDDGEGGGVAIWGPSAELKADVQSLAPGDTVSYTLTNGQVVTFTAFNSPWNGQTWRTMNTDDVAIWTPADVALYNIGITSVTITHN